MVSSQNDQDLCFCYSLDGNCLYIITGMNWGGGDVKVIVFILKQNNFKLKFKISLWVDIYTY